MSKSVEQLHQDFHNRFGIDPLIVRSPGRINLIGEHTDYNDGFVLPAAIDKAIYVAVQKRGDKIIRLYSAEYKDSVEINVSDIVPLQNRWPNYILGVVAQLMKRGSISGFDLVIDGDVPVGAGLSSSAAVECATAFALNELFQLNISKLELVKIAQKAEHEFAGVWCGIMDQFASMFGKAGHAIKLDCRSLEYSYEPMRFNGYKIILFDTQVKHSLASSEYNMRRKQCETGVDRIRVKHPQVRTLRDVTQAMIDECLQPGSAIHKRCRYVIDEIARLNLACTFLQNDDLINFGQQMFETHHGLSKEFEVSCAELDFLFNQVRNNTSVIGARMMGGGFGGCTVNIVKEEEAEKLIHSVSNAYATSMSRELKAFVVSVEDGTQLIKIN